MGAFHFPPGSTNMLTTTTITILLVAFVLGYGLWFGIGVIRYIRSGEYDIDKRLWELRR